MAATGRVPTSAETSNDGAARQTTDDEFVVEYVFEIEQRIESYPLERCFVDWGKGVDMVAVRWTFTFSDTARAVGIDSVAPVYSNGESC